MGEEESISNPGVDRAMTSFEFVKKVQEREKALYEALSPEDRRMWDLHVQALPEFSARLARKSLEYGDLAFNTGYQLGVSAGRTVGVLWGAAVFTAGFVWLRIIYG